MVAGYAAPGCPHQTSRHDTFGRWNEVRATSRPHRLGRDGLLVLALPSLIVLALGVVLVWNPVTPTDDGSGSLLAAAPTTTTSIASPPVDVAGATEARDPANPTDSQLLALAVGVLRSELDVARSEHLALRARVAELEARIDRLDPPPSPSGR